MPAKSKYTIEEKIKACEDYINGVRSPGQICEDLGMGARQKISLYNWFDKYKVYGADAFIPCTHTKRYSKEFKTTIVKEYLEGKSSIRELVVKYKLGGAATVRRWIMMYNSNITFKDSKSDLEVYMASARRKTTVNERVEIVVYCIENNNDYKNTAKKYGVSYEQVYSWVRKYNELGIKGLSDKRGRRKNDEEIDELEKLRRENLDLKRQLAEKDMAVELLKKVKEFERRRFSLKEN